MSLPKQAAESYLEESMLGPPPPQKTKKIRGTLRQLLSFFCRTDSQLEAFCDSFPAVKAQFSNGMDRLAKETYLLEAVPAEELLFALSEEAIKAGIDPPELKALKEELHTAPAQSEGPPQNHLIARVIAACRNREGEKTGLRIECLLAESDLGLLRVSYNELGRDVSYGLGATSLPVTQTLLDGFKQAVHRYCLDMPVVRLVYSLPPGTVPIDLQIRQAALRSAPQVGLVSLREFELPEALGEIVVSQNSRLKEDRELITPSPPFAPHMCVAEDTSFVFTPRGTSALQTVLDWLFDPGRRLLLILGAASSGKSLLANEVVRHLGNQNGSIVPLLCRLGPTEKPLPIETLIHLYTLKPRSDLLRELDWFRSLYKQGRVVLLLDDFHLLSPDPDHDHAYQQLELIMSAVEGNAKILLTSRTGHFLSADGVLTNLAKQLERIPTYVGHLLPYESKEVQDG